MRPASAPSRALLFDALLALSALTLMVGTAAAEGVDPGYRAIDAGAVALMAASAGALRWRRSAPGLTLAVTTLAVVTYDVGNYTGGPIYVMPIFGMYALAAKVGKRRAAPGAAVAAAAIYVPWIFANSNDPVALHVFYLTWIVAGMLLGDASRNRRVYVTGIEERARHLEETREEEARRRVAEERLRIARDLHDSVAHSLASISVQAGAGAHVADRRPDDARAALLAIRQASQDALTELRSTLGVLRADAAEDGAPRAPVSTMARIEALVAGTRQAGLPVDVTVHGVPRPLQPAVEEAAYRIVQEALTNTLRHAGPANSTVTLSYDTSGFDVCVADDGTGPNGNGDGSGPNGGQAGHGLVGMRERVVAAGGEVTTGPGPAGRGFLVRAHLPS